MQLDSWQYIQAQLWELNITLYMVIWEWTQK